MHLKAVSDLDSQDAGLSKTGHVFELQPKWFTSLSDFKSDAKVKIQGVAASASRARGSKTESSPEVRPHFLDYLWGRQT